MLLLLTIFMQTENLFKTTVATALTGLIFCACQNKQQDSAADNHSDFKVLVVEQGNSQVKLFDSNGMLLDSIKVGYNPHEIELDSTNQRAFISNFGVEDYDYTIGVPGTTVSVIDVTNLADHNYWTTYRPNNAGTDTSKGPHGLKLRPPLKKELYVNVEFGDSMLVYNAHNGQIKRTFPVAKGLHNFEFSSSGKVIWALAGTNGIYKYDADTGEELGHFPTNSAVRGITLTANEQSLILSCNNEIYIINSTDFTVQKHFKDLGVKQIIYSCLSLDERKLFAPCPYDNLVLVIDMETGEIEKRISTGKAPIYVKIAPSGKQAFVSNALDNHMSVINLSDYSVSSFGNVFKPNGFLFLE